MADFKETVVGYIDSEKTASLCSGERKWINRILKLKAEHPDEIDIKEYPESNHGIMLAHFPKKWLKINPPRQMSDEQKAAAAERLRAIRESQEEEDEA